MSDGEEAVARAQLKKLGWAEELFELVVGADSGAHVEPCDRVTVWPSGRLAVWPCDRLAVWPSGRVAVWPSGRLAV